MPIRSNPISDSHEPEITPNAGDIHAEHHLAKEIELPPSYAQAESEEDLRSQVREGLKETSDTLEEIKHAENVTNHHLGTY